MLFCCSFLAIAFSIAKLHIKRVSGFCICSNDFFFRYSLFSCCFMSFHFCFNIANTAQNEGFSRFLGESFGIFLSYLYLCKRYMSRFIRFINKTLSVRLSLTIVVAIATLLMASLFLMLRHSRKTVKHEALEKATQTLETTVLRIDNVLFSVEQATGNMMWNIERHLDQPERMFTYSRKLVESNPYIKGCAIAFEPYYSGKDKYFMAYFYRSGTDSLDQENTPLIQAEAFGDLPYLEQEWYTMPIGHLRIPRPGGGTRYGGVPALLQ